MKHFIGIDGGGTKTHLKASCIDKNIIGESFSGSSNIFAVGRSEVNNSIAKLLDDFYLASNLDRKDCEVVCLGTAGFSSDIAVRDLKEILENQMPYSRIIVIDDAVSALIGGTLSNTGIVLVSGTGSICYGRNAYGLSHRTGGWGHIIGDEGSAYHISCRILNSIMKSYDSRKEKTILSELVYDYLKINCYKQIIEFLYYNNSNKKDIAKLASLCDIAYTYGDKAAKEIIYDAANDLAEMVITVAKKLNLIDNIFNCVYTGGNITNSAPLKEQFTYNVKTAIPTATVSKGKEDAAYGCLLVALGNTGHRERENHDCCYFKD